MHLRTISLKKAQCENVIAAFCDYIYPAKMDGPPICNGAGKTKDADVV